MAHRARIVEALSALVQPMNAYLETFGRYIPLINTNVEQALAEWEQKMSAQTDISGVIPIVRRHLDAAKELTHALSMTECVGIFSINSASLRDALVCHRRTPRKSHCALCCCARGG